MINISADDITITCLNGLLFKSISILTVDEISASVETNYSNLLMNGEEYKKIKSKDIIAIRSSDSGFKSLKKVIYGIFLLLVGIQITSIFGFGVATTTTLGIAIYLIFVGLQKEFSIFFDYFSTSGNLPAVMGGSIGIKGKAALPIEPLRIAKTVLGSWNTKFTDSVEVKEGFLGLSVMKFLDISSDILLIRSEHNVFTPTSTIIIPIKNILTVQVYPNKFRSVKIGMIGILIFIGSIGGMIGGEFLSIIYVGFGVVLSLYGFSKLMKTVLTYSIVGNDISSIIFDGQITYSSIDTEQIGELIMSTAIQAQQEVMNK